MKIIKERDIQKQILDWLRYNKVFCYKHNSSGIIKPNGSYIPTGMRGISDIIGILPNSGGQFLAIEVKRKKGRLTQEQAEFIENINRAGGVAFVARGLEDVEKVLKEYV